MPINNNNLITQYGIRQIDWPGVSGQLFMQFKKGDRMLWKKTGQPAYEKQDSNDFGLWLSLDEKQLQLPVEKRFGFKWDDQTVFNYYDSIMTFELNNP